MCFYKKGLVPKDFQPSWDYWEKVPSGNINDLASIAVDLDPRKDIHSILRDAKEDLENAQYSCEGFSDMLLQKYDDVAQIEQTINEIEKRKEEIEQLIILHISEGILHGECDEYGNIVKIKLSNFIEWLKMTKILYPKELEKSLSLKLKQNKNSLSKGEKSSLTQQNNQLKRLFKQVVDLHYNDDVTAYQIAKDISTDEKTIKKYL